MKRQLIIGHFITLLLGGMVYLSFRSNTLVMFSWFDKINLLEPISELRLITLPLSANLPNWFLYSLPDGLWLFSYLTVLLVIWDNTISKQNIQWFFFSSNISYIFRNRTAFRNCSRNFWYNRFTFLLRGIDSPNFNFY